jgi:hypothetical protein
VTQFILQLLDPAADCRLRHMQRFGCPAESIVANHLDEVSKLSDIHFPIHNER